MLENCIYVYPAMLLSRLIKRHPDHASCFLSCKTLDWVEVETRQDADSLYNAREETNITAC